MRKINIYVKIRGNLFLKGLIFTTDTIAAISTPLSNGGIGIIRISGNNAVEIADKVFVSASGKKLDSINGYQALFGKTVDSDGEIDETVALKFVSPKSYTGEDVVELSVHSGPFILKKLLRAVIDAGARLAAPGEFTQRAFLNGKLDLTEAESVMELISSDSRDRFLMSRAAKNGVLSKKTEEITSELLTTAASLAVYADYPDEEIENLNPDSFLKMLNDNSKKLGELLESYEKGKIITSGYETAIVGRPNVGKSTLMNLLCGEEKSIVTSFAGTTRDVVEETVLLDGITLKLSDTAGIHDTKDEIESIGVTKAKERMDNSLLVLAVFDASEELTKEDKELLKEIKDKRTVAVINKTDKERKIDLSAFENIPAVFISAKNGTGREELEKKIKEITETDNIDMNSAILFNERQRDCVKKALASIESATEALTLGMTLDAVSVCIDDGIKALLELKGEKVTDRVADTVFSKFCVGK